MTKEAFSDKLLASSVYFRDYAGAKKARGWNGNQLILPDCIRRMYAFAYSTVAKDIHLTPNSIDDRLQRVFRQCRNRSPPGHQALDPFTAGFVIALF